MGNPIASGPARQGPARDQARGGRRLEELIGFLLLIFGLLALLSLLSHSVQDPSFNTRTPVGVPIHNWIGIVGSYGADLLFQTLGWVAYLVPLTFFVVGGRLALARPLESPRTKAAGWILLVGSLAALLDLFPYTPRISGLIPGFGLTGYLVALGLVDVLNRTGAAIVAGALFLTSLFMVTRFSFSSAYGFLRPRFAFAGAWAARWKKHREEKHAARLRRKLERKRAAAASQPVITAKAKPPSPPVEPKIAVPAPPERKPAPPALPSAPVSITQAIANVKPLKAKPGPPVTPVAVAPPLSEAEDKPPKIVGRGHQGYKPPSITLLRQAESEQGIDEEELKQRATSLTQKFAEFGVIGAVTQIHPGPVVTTYEFKPEPGIKYSRIVNLVDDLCLAMKAESILIERVPGKSTIGIEVPNLHRETIHLREIIESSEFAASASKLTLSLGKDVTGKIKIANLSEMPHLLIAGSTGSGKSVGINSFIVSVLYKATPDEVKLIMIDPKRLELNLYEGVPHLYTPIVTEPKQAANVLRRATLEMEARLRKLAEHGVRNIEQYNKIFEADTPLNLFEDGAQQDGPLPYIMIVIDELADLMMVEPQGVEESITRLAQMARAVGIHLILSTQRPSVDVLTGLIKANMPSRIAFRVASKVDSRTILDSNGAEALLGRGDMLFVPPGSARLLRLHGPLVTEKEIGKVVEWWKAQSKPAYNEEFLKPVKERDRDRAGDSPDEEEDGAELDEVYEEAVRLVIESGKASTSLLQRRLRLGYGRAARLIDLMEKDGIVSAPDGSKSREVLKKPDWLQELDSSLR